VDIVFLRPSGKRAVIIETAQEQRQFDRPCAMVPVPKRPERNTIEAPRDAMRRMTLRGRLRIGLILPLAAFVAVGGDLLWTLRHSTVGAWTGAGVVLVLVLAGLSGWLTLNRVWGRIDEIGARAEAVAAGRPDVPPLAPSGDELDRVSEALDRLSRKLVRRETQVALLRELGEMLQASRDRREACEIAARIGAQIFPGGSGALYMFDGTRTQLRSVAGWGRGATLDPPDVFAPSACWALRRGRPHKVDPTTSDVPCAHVAPSPKEPAHLCVPMIAHGEALGVLSVSIGRDREGAAPVVVTANRERLAQTIAEQVSVTIANLRLHAELREQSVRDPLTGLFNRRYLESVLEQAFRQAERSRRSLTVVLLDLDHFKRINDNHGHEAGDAVLREVAGAIEASLRRGDVACRWGGEEFVAILPETGREGGLAVARKIQSRLRSTPLRYGEADLGRITASFGVAWFPGAASEPPGLLRAADAAMYRAKQEGRDRIETAGADAA
jgi:diguanylate cyclase (GGDEF)-like protein